MIGPSRVLCDATCRSATGAIDGLQIRRRLTLAGGVTGASRHA
jgi:hypothetical protein